MNQSYSFVLDDDSHVFAVILKNKRALYFLITKVIEVDCQNYNSLVC